MAQCRRGEVGFLINGLDRSLKAAEESFCTDQGRFEVYRIREFVDCFVD
jgi:hypothetical protein